MARITSFLTLLLAPYTSAFLLDSNYQQPLVGSIAKSPIQFQPMAWEANVRTAIDPTRAVTCTAGQVKVFLTNKPRELISAVLTFQIPKAKYCWLEFVAPAGAKGNFDLRVLLLEAPLTCPKPGPVTGWRPVPKPNEPGRFKITPKGGNSTWDSRINRDLNYPWSSECKNLAEFLSVELVPQEGIVDIDLSWGQSEKTGLRLMVSN